jgi:hypothetical protein
MTQAATLATPRAKKARKAPVTSRSETNLDRLLRVAAEADAGDTGVNLGELSREERRRHLFG